jgi:hypothetical protein
MLVRDSDASSHRWLTIRGTPSPVFSEVLILKDFKSFVSEVLIPQGLRRHFGELRIANGLGTIFACARVLRIGTT